MNTKKRKASEEGRVQSPGDSDGMSAKATRPVATLSQVKPGRGVEKDGKAITENVEDPATGRRVYTKTYLIWWIFTSLCLASKMTGFAMLTLIVF